MTQKIPAEKLRDKDTKEIQRIINDQRKQIKSVFSEEFGRQFPENPSESIGTMKKNIARCKTVLNERGQLQ